MTHIARSRMQFELPPIFRKPDAEFDQGLISSDDTIMRLSENGDDLRYGLGYSTQMSSARASSIE